MIAESPIPDPNDSRQRPGLGSNGLIWRRFGWANGLDRALVYGDPELRIRAARSWDWASAAGPDVEVRDGVVNSAQGPVPIRLYLNAAARNRRPGPHNRPALVWVHGGGFVSGDLDMRESDVVAREIVHRSGAVVIAVGYPTTNTGARYPTLHRSVMAAVDWTAAHSREFAIDPGRIVLGGASAGANLVLGAALEMRDRGTTCAISGIILAYPLAFRRLPDDPEMSRLDAVPDMLRIAQNDVDRMFAQYAPDGNEPYASADTMNPTGLPRTVVLVAGLDDLAASAVVVADRLSSGGVNVSVKRYEHAVHGFLGMSDDVEGYRPALTAMSDFVTETG
jgi:acetyl esterase